MVHVSPLFTTLRRCLTDVPSFLGASRLAAAAETTHVSPAGGIKSTRHDVGNIRRALASCAPVSCSYRNYSHF